MAITSDILLTVGIQCLLFSFCAYFSYGSWNEFQQNLSFIGCSCLFIYIFIYLMIPSKNAIAIAMHKTNSSKSKIHLSPTTNALKSPPSLNHNEIKTSHTTDSVQNNKE